MMLRYLDTYFLGDYVPSSLETSDGIALIQHLVPYLNDPGSTPSDVINGLEDYLDDRNINDDVVFDYAGIGIIMNVVLDSHPYVLGVHNHPTYDEHWVTGYGYYSTNYAIVNDGWGSTNVYINLSYTDYMIYLD